MEGIHLHISTLTGLTFLLWLLFWGAMLRLIEIYFGDTSFGKALAAIY